MTALQGDVSGTREKNLRLTVVGLLVWLTLSVFLILVYAVAAWPQGLSKVVSIFSHWTLIAVAFSSVGSLTGFLFGIPRTLQSVPSSPAKGNTNIDDSGNSGGDAVGYQQAVNTNLEQISDWLTKILVGVGLTQLQHIPEKLKNMANYFQPGLGGNAPVSLVILLNSMVFGFFAGYLLTRLFLAAAFYGADNLTKKEQFARGLTEAGAYSKAISTLEAALAQVGPNTPPDVKKNIYEGLTYNYLYLDPPEGFQKAIAYGEAYNEQQPDNPSARIWAYLAAAYGQQYKWEGEHGKRQSVLEAARKNALNAIDKALKIEPRVKPLLRLLWDPNDPGKVAGSTEEDDLEVFYSDPEFEKLLN